MLPVEAQRVQFSSCASYFPSDFRDVSVCARNVLSRLVNVKRILIELWHHTSIHACCDIGTVCRQILSGNNFLANGSLYRDLEELPRNDLV